MADEHDRECFNNPLILYSEHKRVLGDAIKRGDEQVRAARYRGYLEGVAATMWLALIVGLICGVAGLNFGLNLQEPQNNVCVPLYDNTGYERCQ